MNAELDKFVQEVLEKKWVALGSFVADGSFPENWSEDLYDEAKKDPRIKFDMEMSDFDGGIAHAFFYDAKFESLEDARKG